MKLQFSKYQGTGNDFILIDNRNKKIKLTTEQIKFLCDRRFGIGADGLMLLELESGYDFKMVYFNGDGKESSMCGNGGRCLSAYAKKLNVVNKEAYFLAIDGAHKSTFDGNTISLEMQDVKAIEQIGDDYFLNTGSPHYVRTVSDLKNFDVYSEGRRVRYNDRFKEQGTNVNFIEKIGDTLHVRTYERGVEDETLSCGTGVTAAALIASHLNLFEFSDYCNIETPGGKLNVSFDKISEGNYQLITLSGPAEFVFEGEVEI